VLSDDLADKCDRIADRVSRATLPLFKPNGRRQPELVGCSVAVRRGDDFFLFTARHVVIDLKMTDFHIWTPGDWIMASGAIARTELDKRGRDRLDAAVIRLDTAIVNSHVREHALTIDDLDMPPPGQGGPYLMQLVGYPGGEVVVPEHKAVSPTYFQWIGTSADTSAYSKRGRAESFHALFDFDRAQSIHNERGRHPGPDMHGASGSGIWRHLQVGEGIERRRRALLTAIVTEYEGRMIIGTRVGVHVALVAKYFQLSAS
jgi:hypothetical protein